MPGYSTLPATVAEAAADRPPRHPERQAPAGDGAVLQRAELEARLLWLTSERRNGSHGPSQERGAHAFCGTRTFGTEAPNCEA